MNLTDRFDIKFVIHRCVVQRALLMAVIVGSILVLINHGVCILKGHFGLVCLIQTVMTFMVPYVVSTVSSVMAMSDPRCKAIYDSSTTSNR